VPVDWGAVQRAFDESRGVPVAVSAAVPGALAAN
jgi:hypothetical protein